ERAAVAAIVAADHSHTGVVPIEHWATVGRAAPWRVAETHALALCACRADQLEIGGVASTQDAGRVATAGKRKAEPPPVRVRRAQRLLAAVGRDHTKIIKQHFA